MGRMRLSGRGAYTRNSLMGGEVPYVSNPKIGGDLATQIRHREYLGDISVVIPAGRTLSEWQLVGAPFGYPINPGMSETFPWLSNVAERYIQYTVNGMVVEYISTSGAAVGSSSNQSLGSVSLAVQYDSILPPYTSKSAMLNDQSSVSGLPFNNHILGIECAPQQTTLTKQYIRNAEPPANADIRMYDLGQFYVAVDGIQCAVSETDTTVKLGELWVSYDIILLKASLALAPLPTPPIEDQGIFKCYAVGNYSVYGCLFPSVVWPAAGASSSPWTFVPVTNTLGATLTANLLTLPPIGVAGYQYLVMMQWATTTDGTAIATRSGTGPVLGLDIDVTNPNQWTVTNGFVSVAYGTFGGSNCNNTGGSTAPINQNIFKLGGTICLGVTDPELGVTLAMNGGTVLRSPNSGSGGMWSVTVYVVPTP